MIKVLVLKRNVYLIIGRDTPDRIRKIVDEHIRVGNMEYIDIKVLKEELALMKAEGTKEKIIVQTRYSNFTY